MGAILWAGCATSSSNAASTFGPTEAASSTYSQPVEATRPVEVAGNADAPVGGGGGYKIGALDVLDISVFQVPELTKSVQVADTGTINLPLVGEVFVVGKTAQQVERDLTAKLGAEYLQNPQVTVYVKEYNSQTVTIEGAIQKPGVFPIKGRTSLLQLIAMANGFDPNSDWTVLVLRQSDAKKSAAKFDVDAIQKGRAEDPVLQAGDIVIAGSSAIKKGFNSILKALPIAGLFSFL